MKYWHLVAICVSLIQPLSSQAHPPHQTSSKDQKEAYQASTDTRKETTPPAASNKAEDPPTPESRPKTDRDERRREFKWGLTKAEFITAGLTAIYVGLTLTYVVISILTLYAMKKQSQIATLSANAAKKSADVAELALRTAERADVLLNACSAGGELLDGTDFRVVLEFKNFGRTRAKEVKLALHLVIDGVPETDCGQIPPISMGAGETKNISSEQFADFLTSQTATAIFARKIPLKFFGGATYKDIFDSPHKSHYTGTYDWDTQCFHIDGQDSD